jgi:hypothetical protein
MAINSVRDEILYQFGLTLGPDVIKIDIIVVIKAMKEKVADTCLRERMPRLGASLEKDR